MSTSPSAKCLYHANVSVCSFLRVVALASPSLYVAEVHRTRVLHAHCVP
jgi:hypothetical protein